MVERLQRTHILLIDGTFSRLVPGHETNIGLIYRLLEEVGPRAEQSFGYHPGVQGRRISGLIRAAIGVGLNDAILDAYSRLASSYQSGDRIILLGYSRGAYAVRSLAGWIGRIGLLKAEYATERRVLRAFRYYQKKRRSGAAIDFSHQFCHPTVEIEMIGAFDTVRALGLPFPFLNRMASLAVDFHDHSLSTQLRRAFHALALDETRGAYAPILWRPASDWAGEMEQVWFAGAHADVGGQHRRDPQARGLSNIPLVWMLERLESAGVALPEGWQNRFPCDPTAPVQGSWRGIRKLFLLRRRRQVRQGQRQTVHGSVLSRMRDLPGYHPKAHGVATDET